LAGVAIVDPLTAGLALATTLLVLRGVPSLWMVAGGAAAGIARGFFL
jgi:hypothetical protein